ncbi:hypothetical protein M0804_008541 [Polistes exclamans]|nr:hypothetical protein M0804_008541 [Polistes exclamans]
MLELLVLWWLVVVLVVVVVVNQKERVGFQSCPLHAPPTKYCATVRLRISRRSTTETVGGPRRRPHSFAIIIFYSYR